MSVMSTDIEMNYILKRSSGRLLQLSSLSLAVKQNQKIAFTASEGLVRNYPETHIRKESDKDEFT